MAENAAIAAAQISGLEHLPHSVIAVILRHLLGDGSGGTRDLVHLAFSCRSLQEAVAAAEHMWQQQCLRLGWSLDWLSTLPLGTPCWHYFCRRMSVRWSLRRQLRCLARFLDPVSAAAIRPASSVQEIREVEAALQAPLPWELFELYRWCDGQEAERGYTIHFLDAARLLSLREMLAAVQEAHGPLDPARSFARLAGQQPPDSTAASGDGSGSSGSSMGSHAGANHNAYGGSGGIIGAARSTVAGASCLHCDSRGTAGDVAGASSGATSGSSLPAPTHPQPWQPGTHLAAPAVNHFSAPSPDPDPSCHPTLDHMPPPGVLLPFTSELRGRKRYWMDLEGAVWLASGFNTLHAATSLEALIQRVLT